MYLLKVQIAMVWPYDDQGRLLGEDVWEFDETREGPDQARPRGRPDHRSRPASCSTRSSSRSRRSTTACCLDEWRAMHEGGRLRATELEVADLPAPEPRRARSWSRSCAAGSAAPTSTPVTTPTSRPTCSPRPATTASCAPTSGSCSATSSAARSPTTGRGAARSTATARRWLRCRCGAAARRCTRSACPPPPPAATRSRCWSRSR